MSLVWQLECPLGEKIVLLKMADCANDRGESIYPLKSEVARLCGCSEKNVQRVWSKYREKGILGCDGANGGRGKATVYSFDLERLKEAAQSSFIHEETGTHSPPNHEQTETDSPPCEESNRDSLSSFGEEEPGLTVLVSQTNGSQKGDCESQKGDTQGRAIELTNSQEGLLRNRQEPSGEGVLGEGSQTAIVVDDAGLVVQHFNLATGHRFTVEGQRRFVQPRLRDGATVEQLNLVADHKAACWLGDDQMRQHLCPETVFRVSKWERNLMLAQDWDAEGRPPVPRHNGRAASTTISQKLAALGEA
jgi:uncharacterized phage protein (TIGR02220 family)